MMQNFSDHAANERTFLSWVRTAIAIMGFGFVVEKIGLLQPAANGTASVAAGMFGTLGEFSGLALIVLGLSLMAVATARFLALRKALSQPAAGTRPTVWIDVSMAVLLGVLAIAVAIYMVHLAIK